jgi:hypothetical protein
MGPSWPHTQPAPQEKVAGPDAELLPGRNRAGMSANKQGRRTAFRESCPDSFKLFPLPATYP